MTLPSPPSIDSLRAGILSEFADLVPEAGADDTSVFFKYEMTSGVVCSLTYEKTNTSPISVS